MGEVDTGDVTATEWRDDGGMGGGGIDGGGGRAPPFSRACQFR